MYLTKGLSCGINRSASILFAGLFVLSNVVRYKPDFWMKEVEGERSGSASIVEAFCTLARRKLPKVLLEKFWKEVFTFGSPGYFV
ncbi:MAG: hypothetical protein U9R60_02260 [Bacteroidota bacterium]|nr:hypothetical protein [Bacteroidota bacterium]